MIISKKTNFKENQINETLLKNTRATSLISKAVSKLEIDNFIAYIYTYDHIDDEIYGYSYYSDNENLYLINGMVNIDGQIRNHDIKDFFNRLKDDSDLLGDYQIISINQNGNGFIKTPPLSLRQLFFYEDENCCVLSTEIKLIVDGIKKFTENKFVNHFDIDFIEDSIFNEWINRLYPKNTIFKRIKRIFPHDIKYFSNGKIIIERKNNIKVPKWFRDAYNKDKSGLYDFYFETLMNFAESNLVKLKPNIKTIFLGLTGGYDSRLTASILYKLCKRYQIPLIGYTSGNLDHPDVIIAKKITNILDIKHFHHHPHGNCFKNTKTYDDNSLTFFMAQGDFNSLDFVPYYERKLSERQSPLNDDSIPPAIGVYPTNESEIYQIGLDSFKRLTMDRIIASNRWYARRILSQGNFIFPLFSTKLETWFTLIYAEKDDEDYYKEFIYEILKRAEPKLLKIPAVGDSLPQINLKPYSETIDSKYHEKEAFIWDYNYVKINLSPLLRKKLSLLSHDEKSILNYVGFNELDYFYNREISNILYLFKESQIDLRECFRRLLLERFANKYPRNKCMIKMNKNTRIDPHISTLQILMDFAAAAEKCSFEEIMDSIRI